MLSGMGKREHDRMADGLARITAVCDGLPEAQHEMKTTHTAYSVRGKKFAYHLVEHHGDGRIAFECKAAPGENTAMVASEPERYFLPKYMAHHGWVGVWLDAGPVDWDEVRELMTEAYCLMAPKRLAAQVTASLPLP
jgi:hypothetical protein